MAEIVSLKTRETLGAEMSQHMSYQSLSCRNNKIIVNDDKRQCTIVVCCMLCVGQNKRRK